MFLCDVVGVQDPNQTKDSDSHSAISRTSTPCLATKSATRSKDAEELGDGWCTGRRGQ